MQVITIMYQVPWYYNTTFTDSQVSCLSGDVALSANYQLVRSITDNFFPDVWRFAGTFTIVSEVPTGWITSIEGKPTQKVITLVHCFDNPPLRP